MNPDYTSVRAIVNRILVVEDNRDEAEFLKTFLQQHKYDVDLAKDAGQAASMFNMHPADFVICDIMLPNDVSGFEVCERIKRINRSVPVLFLTAIDMDDARSLAERIGADGYLTKPYDPDELIEKIHEISERVWARDHLESDSSVIDKVRFECGECGKHLKAKATHRGRTLNCPKCGQPVVIPLHD